MILVFFLIVLLYNKNLDQLKNNLFMGNSSVFQEKEVALNKEKAKHLEKQKVSIFQQDVIEEMEQDRSPLATIYSKGIMRKQIIASNNKLIDSHNHIPSSRNTPKIFKTPKPRTSLDGIVSSIVHYEEIQEFAQQVQQKKNEEDVASTDSFVDSLGENSNLLPSFQPISLDQENLINVRQVNINLKYKLLEKIGEGGFGSVYKAHCFTTSEFRAIKVIQYRNFSAFHKQFILNEISMLLKIDHPNIIKVYEIIQYQSFYYIVMEYCDGGTLGHFIKNYPIKNRQIFAKIIMHKIFSALCYLHSKNIMHRDIKLQNIVVRNEVFDGKLQITVKIIDFGFAFQYSSAVIKENKIIGTPQYLSPQAIKGYSSQKSDIWSSGIIMHHILLGYGPFTAETKVKIFDKIKNNRINTQNSQWSLISHEGRNLIKKLLCKELVQRPTAQEILKSQWFKQINNSPLLSNDVGDQIVSKLINHKKQNNFISFIETYICLTKIGQRERNILIKHFNSIDTNQNGLIELHELQNLLKNSKAHILDIDIQGLLKKLDLNKNSAIDLNQFICALTDVNKILKGEYLKEIFALFDKNKDGFVDENEIKSVMKQCDVDQIAYFLQLIDKNQDKRISMDEFREYLQKYKRKQHRNK